MEYRDLKQLLGEKSADRLENAVLLAFAEARTPQSLEALTRLLAFLTATVAHRVTSAPDIDARCVSDFSKAYQLLQQNGAVRP